jgi:hypothetical protein
MSEKQFCDANPGANIKRKNNLFFNDLNRSIVSEAKTHLIENVSGYGDTVHMYVLGMTTLVLGRIVIGCPQPKG